MGKSIVKKVLVCINGTSESIKAAMYTILFAKQIGCSVKALYVVDTATIKFLLNSRFLATDEKVLYEKKFNQDGKHYLEYVESLARTKGIKIESQMREGSVCYEIIEEAESWGADMIIVGGKKKQPLSKQLSDNPRGSIKAWSTIGNQLMAYASCPVLVVNREGIEETFKVS
ncbi:MAG: universal stress protein [Treponema sp.]|nr:universal stress protein [Treponema sp.]